MHNQVSYTNWNLSTILNNCHPLIPYLQFIISFCVSPQTQCSNLSPSHLLCKHLIDHDLSCLISDHRQSALQPKSFSKYRSDQTVALLTHSDDSSLLVKYRP